MPDNVSVMQEKGLTCRIIGISRDYYQKVESRRRVEQPGHSSGKTYVRNEGRSKLWDWRAEGSGQGQNRSASGHQKKEESLESHAGIQRTIWHRVNLNVGLLCLADESPQDGKRWWQVCRGQRALMHQLDPGNMEHRVNPH